MTTSHRPWKNLQIVLVWYMNTMQGSSSATRPILRTFRCLSASFHLQTHWLFNIWYIQLYNWLLFCGIKLSAWYYSKLPPKITMSGKMWWHMHWETAERIPWKFIDYPDSKVHETNMGPTWGRQDPGGPHVGHVNLAIWVAITLINRSVLQVINNHKIVI